MFSFFGVFRRITLLKATTSRLDRPDDPAFPYKLKFNLSPPKFMQRAFISMCGDSEEFAIGGKSRQALERYVQKNGIRTHPRLRWMTITGPDGVIESIGKDKPTSEESGAVTG